MSLFLCKLFVLPNKVRQFVCRVEVFVRGAGEIFKKTYRDRTIHEKLRCDYYSNLAGLADDCPSALMNILFPVVGLKIKYSLGRAADNSTTRALAASRSAHTPSHLNLGSEKVEAGKHPGDT